MNSIRIRQLISKLGRTGEKKGKERGAGKSGFEEDNEKFEVDMEGIWFSSWWNQELGNVVVAEKGENEISFIREGCGGWRGGGGGKVCECCVEGPARLV